MYENLNDKVELLFEGTPPLLKELARRQLEFLKSKSIDPVEVYVQMEQHMKLLTAAYLNSRGYLSVYDRRFVDMKLLELIEKLLAREDDFVEKDFYNLARVNFDFNGLKALNDLGGHAIGNRGLRIFVEVLKGGETTRWLEEQGFAVVPSAEGPEEYGMLIYGNGDLRGLVHEIASRYFREVWNTDVSPLLNFAHPSVREKLALLGLGDDIPPNFHFRIAANVGIVLFGEALAQVPVENMSESYEKLIRKVITQMFTMADLRAQAHRSAFKDELGRKNPLLASLYSRMSREVLHLEREVNRQEEQIHALEQKLETEKTKKHGGAA